MTGRRTKAGFRPRRKWRASGRDLPGPASPFYVIDEVEAALDDRNPSRLLALLGARRSVDGALGG